MNQIHPFISFLIHSDFPVQIPFDTLHFLPNNHHLLPSTTNHLINYPPTNSLFIVDHHPPNYHLLTTIDFDLIMIRSHP